MMPRACVKAANGMLAWVPVDKLEQWKVGQDQIRAEMQQSQAPKLGEKVLAILMGLQGSGKSTFYDRYLSSNYIRVNLDTLKTRNKEWILVTQCIEEGKSFAVDNTNPTQKDRERYILPAKAAGYKIVGYFLESKLQDCIFRNSLRTAEEQVPSMAIAATSNKLQIPSYGEGFDKLYFVKHEGQTLTIEDWRETE